MDSIGIIAFSAFIYVSLFIYCCLKYNGILGKMVLGFYTFISLCCFYFALKGAYPTDKTLLWPYMYYIFLSFLLINPLLKHSKFTSRFIIRNVKHMNIICDIYIVSSFLFYFFFLIPAINSILTGAWLSTYLEMRSGDVTLYHGLHQQIVINIVEYFKIPVLLYGFYSYTKKGLYKWKSALLILPFVNSFIWAVYIASRTDLITIIVMYISIYLVFKQYLPVSFKKAAVTFISVIMVFAVSFVIAITASRFGEGETEWLSDYFGDSFRVGHDVIGYTDRIGYGSSFFKTFYNVMGVPSAPFHCSIDNGSAFHPLIALRYADFGFWGTIIYGILVFALFNHILSMKNMSIGYAYIIFYFYRTMFIGGLYDNTTALSWLIVIFISVFLHKYTSYVKISSNRIISSSI